MTKTQTPGPTAEADHRKASPEPKAEAHLVPAKRRRVSKLHVVEDKVQPALPAERDIAPILAERVLPADIAEHLDAARMSRDMENCPLGDVRNCPLFG